MKKIKNGYDWVGASINERIECVKLIVDSIINSDEKNLPLEIGKTLYVNYLCGRIEHFYSIVRIVNDEGESVVSELEIPLTTAIATVVRDIQQEINESKANEIKDSKNLQ